MQGQVLKLLFKSGNVYLTMQKAMTLEQLINLPQVAKNSKSTAYWEIRVLNYTKREEKIFCEILSYNKGETHFEKNQIENSEKLSKIQSVSFRSIDTMPLLRTLVKNNPRSKFPPNSFSTNTFSKQNQQNIHQTEPLIKPVLKLNINEIFFFPLKHLNFKLGYVSFEKKFHVYPKSIEIKIHNEDIREEYDAVKNYFANVLKTKKIKVNVNIDIEGDKIIPININSPEIDKINKQFINEVKIDFVKSTIKKKTNPDIESSLFTIEQYLETFANDDFELKTFYNDDKDFLQDLLNIYNTKHYKHLRLLSSKHSHDIMKLRFIHKPFSFIFLIEGKKYYHFVWETLNTKEATYVWPIEKEIDILKTYLVKIEEIIKAIKIDGKLDYISNTEDKFNRIYHDYSDSINGFIKWKEELEEVLV